MLFWASRNEGDLVVGAGNIRITRSCVGTKALVPYEFAMESLAINEVLVRTPHTDLPILLAVMNYSPHFCDFAFTDDFKSSAGPYLQSLAH